MQVFSAPHFPFGNALEVELYFCGKTFVFRAQTLASVTCQPKKQENAAAHDFVDKCLCEERRPLLNFRALLRIYFTHQTV